jgi:hypothetical protein
MRPDSLMRDPVQPVTYVLAPTCHPCLVTTPSGEATGVVQTFS